MTSVGKYWNTFYWNRIAENFMSIFAFAISSSLSRYSQRFHPFKNYVYLKHRFWLTSESTIKTYWMVYQKFTLSWTYITAILLFRNLPSWTHLPNFIMYSAGSWAIDFQFVSFFRHWKLRKFRLPLIVC